MDNEEYMEFIDKIRAEVLEKLILKVELFKKTVKIRRKRAFCE